MIEYTYVQAMIHYSPEMLQVLKPQVQVLETNYQVQPKYRYPLYSWSKKVQVKAWNLRPVSLGTIPSHNPDLNL